MGPTRQNLQPQFQELADFKFNLLQSIKMLRWIGYGLLLVIVVSLIETFTPFKAMDPVWEFATFRQVVERLPIPLIGLMLVYHCQWYGRTPWEKRLLPWLSRATLVFGILLFLLIPLGIIHTVRIDNRNPAQFNLQQEQQQAQIQAVQERLEQATTAEQIAQVAVVLRRPDIAPKLSNPDQFDSVKTELSQAAQEGLATGKQSIEANQKRTQSTLLKRSIKTNLIALIASIMFIGLWRFTQWARLPQG